MGHVFQGPLAFGVTKLMVLALVAAVPFGALACSQRDSVQVTPTPTSPTTAEASATSAASFTPTSPAVVTPTAVPSPTEASAPEGATITGHVFFNHSPIQDYTSADARFSVYDTGDYSRPLFASTYDANTGAFELSGLPPGTYVASVWVESGDPVNSESGGDFFSSLSGLNPEFTVESATDRIAKDLDTVQIIHLTVPSDNQVPSGKTDGPPQPLPVSLSATFEWDPVPDAVRYEARLLIADAETRVGVSGLSESVTEPRVTFVPAPEPSKEGQQYNFTVSAYNAADETVGVFRHYFVSGSGSWYWFRAIPDE